MWKLSIADDQGQRTNVTLVRDQYTIGRAEGNSVRLTERNVSRQHALVERTKRGIRIRDLDSDNGIFVNGVRLSSEPHDLEHGDLVQIGDYRIDVIDEDRSTQEQAHRPLAGSVSPPSTRLSDRLVVLIGPNQGHEYPLEMDRHLIGRGEECDIPLDHASVSRVHAEVRRIDAEHFEIIDKGSANGLRINSREMPRAVLDGRDVIEIGDVVLKYIPKGQVFRASPAEGARIAALAGASSLPPGGKASIGLGRTLFAAGLGALVAALLAAYLITAPSRARGVERARATAGLAANVVAALDEAVALKEKGDLSGAHRKIQGLGRKPQITKLPDVIAIETAWAKAQLEEARKRPSLAERRALFDEVARTETVPTALRREASDLSQKTAEKGISLEELEQEQGRTEAESDAKSP